MGLINALGLDLKILIAQLVNFAVIYFILKKFAWQPLLNFLEKRQTEIATGLKNAAAARQALDTATTKQTALLTAAKKEAAAIVKTATDRALQESETILAQTKLDAARLVAASEEKINQQKAQLLRETKTALASLVIQGVQDVIATQADPKIVTNLYLEEGLKA
jgi:F-type H+-transporting ATPase subunit b